MTSSSLSLLQPHFGTILILIVIWSLPLCTLLFNELHYLEQKTAAQSVGARSSGTFLEYQNNTYGIRILYPISWKAYDNFTHPGFRNINIVKFDSRSNVSYSENLVVTTDYVNQNETVDVYAAEKVQSYRQDPAFKQAFFTLISIDTTGQLLGLSAYDLLYTFQNPSNSKDIILSHEIGTLIGHHAYYVTYSAEVSRYSVYLPLIQRMIDSLQIDIGGINAAQGPINSNAPEI